MPVDIAVLILNCLIDYSIVSLTRSVASYAAKKGENLATKEDIAELTRLVESVKIAFQQLDRVAVKKYDMKHAACQAALRIVDAQVSHRFKTDNQGNPVDADKQFATISEIRDCHNELILSLDDRTIVQVFLGIMTGTSENAFVDLDKLRGLIRAELGFVGDAYTDSENTWIAKSIVINPKVAIELEAPRSYP